VPTEVTVIRHRKERIAKCSLRFLHDRPGFTFYRMTQGFTFDATGYLLLSVDAPVLTTADRGRPLLLLDSTWRWLPQLESCVRGAPIRRSVPREIKTAYPRISRLFEDPDAGLASVEALYVALRLLGDNDASLLDGYHWKDQFLAQLQVDGT
jgi:pre-rRNA-processing protein TSR3